MAVVRTESRCRIGITWYDTEAEAVEADRKMSDFYSKLSLSEANIGFAQCGRAPEHDQPGEYAVITP